MISKPMITITVRMTVARSRVTSDFPAFGPRSFLDLGDFSDYLIAEVEQIFSVDHDRRHSTPNPGVPERVQALPALPLGKFGLKRFLAQHADTSDS